MSEQKSGFVALLGRPNSGKSSLLNYLLGEKLALVSHKANATRKRLNAIVMHENAQIILVDTPGIHEKERLLNKFMLEEAYKSLGDSDLILFLLSAKDDLKYYEEFLKINKKQKPHFLILTKIDLLKQNEIVLKLNTLSTYTDNFLELFPLSVKKEKFKKDLLNLITKHLPVHPFFYDTDILTTENSKEIYKEIIRESIFKNLSDELPYSSEVIVNKISENKNLKKIFATILVEKESQKSMIIGKDGNTIKRIGRDSRIAIENFTQNKIYLKLIIKVEKNWTKNKKALKILGYHL